MDRYWAVTAWTRRFLLLVAVLLGTVAMHSFGHPAESGPSHPPGSVSAASDVRDHASHDRILLDEVALGLGQTEPSPHSAGHEPLGGMDLSVVCIAVLTAWVVLPLVE